MTVRLSVLVGPEFDNVADRLGREDSSAGRRFSSSLRESTAPIVADVRRHAMTLPARGPKHTGLRGRLAAGVRAQVSGQHVRIVSTMADPTEAALPRGMDNGLRGWRHPVYGNRDVWVQQRGGSWFREPIASHQDAIERDLTSVVEDMAQSIAQAGRAL